MYSLVESVVGSTLLIWGLALAVNKNIIKSCFNIFIDKADKETNEALGYITASLFLILGLIIVWVHNDWYFNSAIIVTLIGWLLTIKSSLWLLFPRFFARLSKKFSPLASIFWFRFAYGAFIIILGALILGRYYIENFVM